MATKDQIESFYRFASGQLANGGCEKSVDELYEQWRFENPTPEDIAENVAAIQASIDDMNGGATGRDAGKVIRELRDALNLPAGK